MRVLTLSAFMVLILAVPFGCQSSPHEIHDALPTVSPSERLNELKSLFTTLQSGPYMDELPLELERANALMLEADSLIAVAEDEEERLQLVMLALEQHIVLLRTYAKRRTAEDSLEGLRSAHEARNLDLEAQRRQADDAIEALKGDAP